MAFCGSCGHPISGPADRCSTCGAANDAQRQTTTWSTLGTAPAQGGLPDGHPPLERVTLTKKPKSPPPPARADVGHRSPIAATSPANAAPAAVVPWAGGSQPVPYPHPTPGRPSSLRNPLVLLVVAVALLAMGMLAYLAVVRPSAERGASAPTTVIVRSAPAPPTGQAGASRAPAANTNNAPSLPPPPPTTTASPSYPPLALPGRLCATTGAGPYANAAAGNDMTSCPFTINVQAAYGTAGGSGTPLTITAYSPVTKKDYILTCVGDQPVTCTGGNNAVVYLYGGTATFTP